jgi:hypothetical protein
MQVDSNDRDRVLESLDYLQHLVSQLNASEFSHLPLLIVCSKQDLPHAQSKAQIANLISSYPRTYLIVEASVARDQSPDLWPELRSGLLWLMIKVGAVAFKEMSIQHCCRPENSTSFVCCRCLRSVDRGRGRGGAVRLVVLVWGRCLLTAPLSQGRCSKQGV